VTDESPNHNGSTSASLPVRVSGGASKSSSSSNSANDYGGVRTTLSVSKRRRQSAIAKPKRTALASSRDKPSTAIRRAVPESQCGDVTPVDTQAVATAHQFPVAAGEVASANNEAAASQLRSTDERKFETCNRAPVSTAEPLFAATGYQGTDKESVDFPVTEIPPGLDSPGELAAAVVNIPCDRYVIHSFSFSDRYRLVSVV